ncbi:hypothetical protein PAXRUDRAFT_700607 [Paxillus rubicundulus Ve08.2h10]|uniref:AB hydrolase-1 domain-containing protein n=1 Tax=Paxillus rubicundulus Ve08.2h10 TaxID=930991 RepID=A0A0D0CMI9_9AGAM|nr:hypothetical protein PAXRUDRAFT_700607 [Paxillus rubicundulus Ve08.2h10]
MWTTSLKVESLVLDTPSWNGHPGLQMTAKRYTAPFSEPEGLTLLFAHGISAHKEQWEPTLQRVFYNQRFKAKHHRVREAWSFDWLNHGDAAELNKEKLQLRPPGNVSAAEWGFAIASFVRSLRTKGRRLVAFGHSAGAGAIMLSTKEFPPSRSPYIAIFLIEPSMLSRELWMTHLAERELAMRKSMDAALRRQHSWSTLEDAIAYFRQIRPWSFYDPKVLDVFKMYGFRTVSAGEGGEKTTRVVRKCSAQHEAFAYADIESHFEGVEQFARICCTTPLHIVFGSKQDYIPSYFQDCVTNVSEGRIPASVVKIPGPGHVIVQEAPDALADGICVGLNLINPSLHPASLYRL